MALSKIQIGQVKYRLLSRADLVLLRNLLVAQSSTHIKYFNPHKFDQYTLDKLWRNPAFIMFGAFKQEKLVGYFFLRFFINHQCFIGRIVDENNQRQGIAKGMSRILYEITWSSGFRCLTTISTENHSIVSLHDNELNTRIIKKLKNNYLLVEIIEL